MVIDDFYPDLPQDPGEPGDFQPEEGSLEDKMYQGGDPIESEFIPIEEEDPWRSYVRYRLFVYFANKIGYDPEDPKKARLSTAITHRSFIRRRVCEMGVITLPVIVVNDKTKEELEVDMPIEQCDLTNVREKFKDIYRDAVEYMENFRSQLVDKMNEHLMYGTPLTTLGHILMAVRIARVEEDQGLESDCEEYLEDVFYNRMNPDQRQEALELVRTNEDEFRRLVYEINEDLWRYIFKPDNGHPFYYAFLSKQQDLNNSEPIT